MKKPANQVHGWGCDVLGLGFGRSDTNARNP